MHLKKFWLFFEFPDRRSIVAWLAQFYPWKGHWPMSRSNDSKRSNWVLYLSYKGVTLTLNHTWCIDFSDLICEAIYDNQGQTCKVQGKI